MAEVVSCPKCGKPSVLIKKWEMCSPRTGKCIEIGLFECPDGHKFRKKIG